MTDETEDNRSTEDLLREVLSQQAEHRAEVKELREQLAKSHAPTPRQSSVALSAEELREARFAEINEHDYYCPACGALYDRPRECTGRGEAPHPALEVISTDELKQDDESKHTAAPGIAP